MSKRSIAPLRRLEVLVIALLVLCQGVQAFHYHLRSTGHSRLSIAIHGDDATDASCPTCWAHQAVGTPHSPLQAGAVECFSPCGPLCAVFLARSRRRAPWSPRGPPSALLTA